MKNEIKVSIAQVRIGKITVEEFCNVFTKWGKTITKDCFILIQASKLSRNDEFMNHEPRNERESFLKKLLMDVIDSEIQDFYCPILNPIVNKEDKIEYVVSSKPTIFLYPAHSYSNWKEIAREYLKSQNSRLGIKLEYVAFCGEYIKQMVNTKWTVADAWDEVCSKGACGDYPVRKILAEDSQGFCTAGGVWLNFLHYDAVDGYHKYIFDNCEDEAAIGWIVHEP